MEPAPETEVETIGGGAGPNMVAEEFGEDRVDALLRRTATKERRPWWGMGTHALTGTRRGR